MTRVLMIGAGRMGGAMLKGWMQALGQGFGFAVIDPQADWHSLGLSPGPQLVLARSLAELAEGYAADVVVLATKPQHVESALETARPAIGPATLVVSIAAGVQTRTLQAACGAGKGVVRAMPNIGALVGRSVTAAFATPEVTATQRETVSALFDAIGAFSWIETEADLHLITALSGSGPAYYFAFCEAMTTAAIAAGLDEEVARILAVGTLVSAGRLLEDNGDPAGLRAMVTSPKGTTAAALAALGQDSALDALAAQALEAARARSVELA
ncbi:MAG: pyrroline-5-carboxylate reductase [Rhodobacteraceae bacterium]|nr:MAG: pyrroline-5-carboxylate reductase [Paracoccaceae bacterium]